jgi:hypothetical protein
MKPGDVGGVDGGHGPGEADRGGGAAGRGRGLDAFADLLVDHDPALHSDLVRLVGAAGAARDAGDEDDAGRRRGDQGGLAPSAGDPAEFLLGDVA